MGLHKNQFKSVASIKLACYFDVLSRLLVQVEIFDKRVSDLLSCLRNQVQKVPQDTIAIYDRGYGSSLLVYLHTLYGSRCVIRLKTDFSKVVKRFVESADNELFIEEPLSDKSYKRLESLGINKSRTTQVSYRLVKVVLSSGEIEVLMTNLDNRFTINDLSEIYRLRWGIETCFNSVKNHLMLGIFSGYSQCSIEQDIWCSMIFITFKVSRCWKPKSV